MNEFVQIQRVYLNGGLPVADVVGTHGYVWRSVKILAGGDGSMSSCMYFPPLSGLGILQRGSSVSAPWGFLAGAVPKTPSGDSVFEDRDEGAVDDSAELPEKCTVFDAVICNGESVFKVDQNGNVCVDTRRSGSPVRFQLAPWSKFMVIQSEAGTLASDNVTEGLLLANRTLEFLNAQLVTKYNELLAANAALYAALQAAVGAAPTGAQAMGAAIEVALQAYSAPSVAEPADENLVSAAFLLSDLSLPEVQDTYLLGTDDEEE